MNCLAEPLISASWTADDRGVCLAFTQHGDALLPPMLSQPLHAWVAAVHRDDEEPAAPEILRALARRLPFQRELAIGCQDGSVRYAILAGTPVHATEGGGFRGALVDVTAQRDRLDKALRGAVAHRLIVEHGNDLIAHCTPDGTYDLVSSAYTRAMGWMAAQLLGEPVALFLHPDDRGPFDVALARVLHGLAASRTVEVRQRDAQGHYVMLETKICPINDPRSGDCTGAVLVARDITREKDMVRRLERMAEGKTALIENSPDIMMLLDQQGTILKVNNAIEAMLGLRPADLVRHARIERTARPDDAANLCAAIDACLRDGHAAVTVSCPHAEGRDVQVAWSMRRPPGSNVIYATARDVTDAWRTRHDLQRSHAQVRTLLESINDGFFSVNAQWEITYANTRAAAFVGADRDATIGKLVWDVAPGLAESVVGANLRAAMASGEGGSFEAYYAPVGVWVSERVYVHEDGLSVFFHDISERVTRERLILESERRFRETIGITPAGYVLLNACGIVEDMNPALSQLSGYAREELIGTNVAAILAAGDDSAALNVQRPAHQAHALETVLLHKQGHHVYALVNQTVATEADGSPASLTAFITDITERKHAEERLEELANRDTLTGLPNRAWINRRVGDMLAQPAGDTYTTLFFIDLNRFKEVNDSMGHAAGDRLLRQVGERLQSCMRPGDVVARLGGDEFVVAASCTGRDAAASIARRLIATLRTPFCADGLEIRVGASIGISQAAPGAATTELLFQNADTAMYKAKARGEASFQFFEPEMNIEAKRRLQLEVALHRALEQGQFELHYQPRIDLRTMRVHGVEALLRWNHPEFGRVPPLEFIPLAEERGHIGAIGHWVLREACRAVKRLNELYGTPLQVSVNVSARQLRSPDLITQVACSLAESSLPAAALELELTESALIEDLDQSAAVLHGLKQLGVRLSIDDFGTGYSSLSYLKRFPVDVLKLDRSFVMETPSDTRDCGFVRAVIQMAHALGLAVVAEGIETPDARDALRGAACDEGQGYLFARPLSVQQLEEYLAQLPEPKT